MAISNSRAALARKIVPVKNDFDNAYQAIEDYVKGKGGTITYITPSKFQVVTRGMALYNLEDTNSVLFGVENEGSIDFFNPPLISTTINADTYVCFSLDLSLDPTDGSISDGRTLGTLKDDFATLLLLSKADATSLKTDGLGNLAWGDTHPLNVWGKTGPLLVGNFTPITIEPSGNYVITLNWFLGTGTNDNTPEGDGIIAHYNVDGKNYYTLRRDFMDRMEVSSTEDSSTSNQ